MSTPVSGSTGGDPATEPPAADGIPPAPPSRQRRRSRPERDPGLRGLARVPLWLVLLLVLLAGVAAIAGAYWGIGELVEVSDEGITPAQRFTAAFAVATALGALTALVVSLRRQDLTEQTTRQEIAGVFTERFASAASQLGGDSAADRIAGVYAMAALADEHPSRRQQCVDVLCGYLRLPFNPDTDHLADRSTTTLHTFHDGRQVTTHEAPAAKPFDRQVRETITQVIKARTRLDASPSWSDVAYNFRGAHLTNLDLSYSYIKAVDLTEATISGDALFHGTEVSDFAVFEGTRFAGPVDLSTSRFSGITLFTGARFTEDVSCSSAMFSLNVTFEGVEFGNSVYFNDTVFYGLADFTKAQFCGNALFRDVAFARDVWFVKAKFSRGASFSGAVFTGDARFDRAAFAQVTRFAHPDPLPAGPAVFHGSRVTFYEARFAADAHLLGLKDAILKRGATITGPDEEPFWGWPPDGKPDPPDHEDDSPAP